METTMTRRTLAVLAVVLAGSQIGQAWTSRAQTPATRFFTIAAVELRGGAPVGQEAFPAQALPPGGGYVIRQPDQTGRWEVSTYLCMPSQIVVNQGDEVTLDFVGVNGAAHPTEIQGLGKTFTLQRGHVARVSFKADKPGVYPVICRTHAPSMRSEIVVVAKP
jgi:heme/copper-type cytochrome/quinol oxidase subunit 2